MGFEEWAIELGLPLATITIGVVSGLVPIVNAEIAAVALAAGTSQPWFVALGITTGQMIAKVVMYGLGRRADLLPWKSLQEKREKAVEWLEERHNASWPVIATSSFLGFPPMYIVAIAAGALRAPFLLFVIIGFIGRGLRFGLIVYGVELIKGWW